jgi:uncharacterized protein
MKGEESARRRLEKGIYARLRRPSADTVAVLPVSDWDLGTFDGRKYCLVITYRKDGRAVPTPVWFVVADDRLYFLTAAASGKAKRIRGGTRMRIAPCTVFGRPLEAPIKGMPRLLDTAEGVAIERALRAKYSLGRRLYYRLLGPDEVVYVEVSPARKEEGDDASSDAR